MAKNRTVPVPFRNHYECRLLAFSGEWFPMGGDPQYQRRRTENLVREAQRLSHVSEKCWEDAFWEMRGSSSDAQKLLNEISYAGHPDGICGGHAYILFPTGEEEDIEDVPLVCVSTSFRFPKEYTVLRGWVGDAMYYTENISATHSIWVILPKEVNK